MRTHHFLSGLLGLALLGLTPLTLTAPATARPDAGTTMTATTVTATAVTGAPLAARAKPRRELNDRSVKRGGSWFIVGRITPDGARKTVEFKRKLSAKAPWRTWKRIKADNRGRFRVEVEFPTITEATWYYKGVVHGSKKYADSRTDIIYTVCRRQNC